MFYQHYQKNKSGRDFVVGDIHGMYHLFMSSLINIGFNKEKDRCFSCGDLIDRGPDSEKCLKLITEPWFHCVIGNHEQLMINAIRSCNSQETNLWIKNGGAWHLNVPPEKMQQYVNITEQQPVLISVDVANNKKIAICHAEYPLPTWAPHLLEPESEFLAEILWSRTRIKVGDTSPIKGIDHVFCGHTITDQPVTLGNTHFIDTGAFATNNLTVICLNDIFK